MTENIVQWLYSTYASWLYNLPIFHVHTSVIYVPTPSESLCTFLGLCDVEEGGVLFVLG